MSNFANLAKNSGSLAAKLVLGVGALGYGVANSFYTGN